ncbi:beta-galactosidase [Nonomuraea sp. NPDC050328]|uniref:beta-galactosidase n=1 Tax=Nonomuraea sp. NPDC050328 TaxID=3364361 RepID=UPI0037B5B9A7
MSVAIEVRDGVTVIDGVPTALVTADYPYYRDHPSVWADRLRAIRDELGIEIITCYLPWRHHQPAPGREPDFTGRTDPATDVLGFLRLCAELGLKVVAKPGPFIHAEVDYGGLPDWVCPTADPRIEALLDADGRPSTWGGRVLPAPLGPAFAAHAEQWLAAVGKEVLDPGGPVVLVQIANEGLYTNGALPLTAYDYSPSGLAFYRERLREWYGTPQEYARVHGHSWDQPPSAEGLAAAADWGRFHAAYLAEVYRRWSEATGTTLPIVVNLNPPTVAHLDDWLARVRPRDWTGIHYGFTNWMGVVSADPEAHARYVIAAKLFPGPNLEENWGFSELYDRAYADAATSFHQSLLALAAGATGVNVYTAAATSGWSRALDSVHAAPYPDCAPIAADGSATGKAPVVRAMAGFLARHGGEFLAAKPVTGGAFGLYAPQAPVAAAGVAGHSCGRSLLAYHARMRAAGLDYVLVDLEHADAAELAGHASITLPGGTFLGRAAQEALAGYLGQGGVVVVEGEVPVLDEHFRPCTLLADALAGSSAGSSSGESPVRVVRGVADAYLRVHPKLDVRYLTVLAADSHEGVVEVETPDGTVSLVTCRGGAAIIRLAGGRLDDVLVKGTNAFLGSAVEASVTYGRDTRTAGHPADLFHLT